MNDKFKGIPPDSHESPDSAPLEIYRKARICRSFSSGFPMFFSHLFCQSPRDPPLVQTSLHARRMCCSVAWSRGGIRTCLRGVAGLKKSQTYGCLTIVLNSYKHNSYKHSYKISSSKYIVINIVIDIRYNGVIIPYCFGFFLVFRARTAKEASSERGLNQLNPSWMSSTNNLI